jgi:hypothetical protein
MMTPIQAADSTAAADTDAKTTVDDVKSTSQEEKPDATTSDSNARYDSCCILMYKLV